MYFQLFKLSAIVRRMGLESWPCFAGRLAVVVGGRMLLNICVPGSGTVVDFAQAVTCFCCGDIRGGVWNTVSGVADLATLGITGGTKDVFKESAKSGFKAVPDEVLEEGANTIFNVFLLSRSSGGH